VARTVVGGSHLPPIKGVQYTERSATLPETLAELKVLRISIGGDCKPVPCGGGKIRTECSVFNEVGLVRDYFATLRIPGRVERGFPCYSGAQSS
jgi:hypothetical protein